MPAASQIRRRPGRVHAPADPHGADGPDDGHVPRGARPDDRLERDPHDRRRPARALGAGLGHDGVPDHLDDLDAALRQALRQLRPQAVLPVRDQRVHHRLGGLRLRHVDVHARGVPRVPGARRRRPDVACAGDHRRHRRAARARPLPGLHPRGLRALERARARDRRVLRGHVEHPHDLRLALGLPRQRADRTGRARRRLAHPEHPAQPAPAPDRRRPAPSR